MTDSKLYSLPNLITASRMLMAPVAAYTLIQVGEGWLWAALLIVVLAVISDWADGFAARAMASVSDLGKLFDPLADAVFFVVVFLALGVRGSFPWEIALVFLVREALQHLYVRPAAHRKGLVMAAKMIGKVKTALQCGVAILLIALEIARLRPGWARFFGEGKAALQTMDTVALIAVAGAAALSACSIVPYLIALTRLKPESSKE